MKLHLNSMLASPLGNVVGLKWEDILMQFDTENPEYFINDEMDYGSAVMNEHIVVYGYEDGFVHTFSSRQGHKPDITRRNFLKTFGMLYEGFTSGPTKQDVMNHPDAKLVEDEGLEVYTSIDLKMGRSFGFWFHKNEMIRIGAADHNLM